jgi:hypothetical protein
VGSEVGASSPDPGIGLRYRWVPGIATVCPGDDLLTVHVQLDTRGPR